MPEAAVGATRFGGLPDLPHQISWPRATGGGLLNFYAQIDLVDLAGPAIAHDLPLSGLLSFFAGELDNGCDPAPVSVLHTPSGTPLARHAPPDPGTFDHREVTLFAPVSVRFAPGLTFPTSDTSWLRALDRTSPDGDIDTLTTTLNGTIDALGQLMGYAPWWEDLREELYFEELGRAGQQRLRQWTTWEEWERAKTIEHRAYRPWWKVASIGASATYRPWSAVDDSNVRWIINHADSIAAGIEQWRSLLTIESNKPMGVSINDANALYFFVRDDHLAGAHFAAVRATTTQS
jgi:hypothetical protein